MATSTTLVGHLVSNALIQGRLMVGELPAASAGPFGSHELRDSEYIRHHVWRSAPVDFCHRMNVVVEQGLARRTAGDQI